MTVKSLAFATVAAVALSAGAALAAPIYATGATWTPGFGDLRPGRSNPDNALGTPDGKFLSLGYGGFADFTFGKSFTGPGAVIEVTWLPRDTYFESAEVWGGSAGSFTKIGEITNAMETIALSFSGIFDTLRIIDTSPVILGRGRDGFDIDSVSVSPVPLPAAGVLLAGALAGVAGLRRMRRKDA
ncbi:MULTISPECIES: VPLPA-CTERM sorting domain-containing protein [Haematobacter]|uniref:VPLPA-CTERM sorting domain-containing protein n=1 Tax=Haematobacter genomosp. 1 TaxID=366618 RepID=A0A212A7G5_9RHOB|nr:MULTISPECIES: VPLPA-CTERM sorting domain-containing protein [Haematobacter]OWJ75222.1 hypothetical protein CDV49_17790 [Haematobacter genomosp. 1]